MIVLSSFLPEFPPCASILAALLHRVFLVDALISVKHGQTSHAGSPSSRGGRFGLPDLLLRDPLRDVARRGDRSVRDAVDRNESKGHLDIKFVPALVQRACQVGRP